VKLGAELSEDVTEATGASGCEGGGTGIDWIGWGSSATGDSLGGFATGSGAGSAAGSLGRRVSTCVVTRKKDYSRFGINNLITANTEATKLHADLLETGTEVIR
jgi:hypothetical protein